MRNRQTIPRRGSSFVLGAKYETVTVSYPGKDGIGPDIYKHVGDQIMQLPTAKTFKHETKCMNCGRSRDIHRAHDKACPVGKGNHLGWNETGMKFVDSGKPTIKSQREFKKLQDEETRTQLRLDFEIKEKSKVRSMTFTEVVEATQLIIYNFTGLLTVVEERFGKTDVELCLMAKDVRLGFTTVVKHSDGSYHVGGCSGGCFMSQGSEQDISNVLRSAFKELEEKANREKVK